MNAEIRRYQVLLNNLNNLAGTLQSSITELENAINYSKISINISAKSYKKIELENIQADLKSEYNNLVNIYIPEARRKINELIQEQRRLEEARRKAAEEAKKQAEAKKAKENDKN